MNKEGPQNGQNSLSNYNRLNNPRLTSSQQIGFGMNWGLSSTNLNQSSNPGMSNNLNGNMYNPNNQSSQMLSSQFNLDSRQGYPASNFYQVQVALQQRSRTSATPHHHAKVAMSMLNGMNSQSSIFGSNYNGISFQSTKNDPGFNILHSFPDESPNNLGSSSQSSIKLRSPTHIKKSHTPIKLSSNNLLPDSSPVGRISRASDSGDSSNNSSNSANKSSDQATSSWDGLDLGGMGLRTLSPDLFNYSFLTKLYLNHNQLASLPSSISNLQELEVLDISGNMLVSLPPQLGLCYKLKELLMFDNRITELPFELGTLYQLETLGLEGNPISEPIRSLIYKKGTRAVIEYIRDIAPATKEIEDRDWITLEKNVDPEGSDVINILTYNVLSQKYAPSSHYGYCPSWALAWDNRREIIIGELLALSSKVICLQEVETSEYSEFFYPKLKAAGYEGVFWAKSRARTMPEEERKSVDGCATFFKSETFSLYESHLLEFQPSALNRTDFKKSEDFFNRFMTKDNICGFSILQLKDKSPGPPQFIIVANAHIHWNPEYTDVKMVQVAMLMEELKKVVSKISKISEVIPNTNKNYSGTSAGGSSNNNSGLENVPETDSNYKTVNQPCVLICGDFNSTPDSGLYEFLSTSKLSKTHTDLAKLESYSDYSIKGLGHDFKLKSAYSSVSGPDFVTNYTPTFKGEIDFIWYSTHKLHLVGILGPLNPKWLSTQVEV
ncbi:hypothetical protein BB560_001627 [Smittium megazygosporum]|uniref:poly(A)-specific ribonuclease n=1 Tax=Smittium megazygosporum TaxID=133381 RepID=A0A2T9ZH25_9FUNG|nr:hypothetical protein BB560_001627 [Smittium megazygosporum]